jgi:hypothetical protein
MAVIYPIPTRIKLLLERLHIVQWFILSFYFFRIIIYLSLRVDNNHNYSSKNLRLCFQVNLSARRQRNQMRKVVLSNLPPGILNSFDSF